jgi:hypothetical protein
MGKYIVASYNKIKKSANVFWTQRAALLSGIGKGRSLFVNVENCNYIQNIFKKADDQLLYETVG